MPVTLTEKAASEVKRIMAEQNHPENMYLRVGVAGGGCSGFSYSLAFDDKTDEAMDDVYDVHGVKMVVDRKSDLYLDGTTLDFFEGLEKRGFVFNNPNATKSCGCGSSFSA
jgi:iron-sulfur cluster assembly accessory protein